MDNLGVTLLLVAVAAAVLIPWRGGRGRPHRKGGDGALAWWIGGTDDHRHDSGARDGQADGGSGGGEAGGGGGDGGSGGS